MDLGLKNKTALVLAASKGLGKACAFALAREGVSLTIGAREKPQLEQTAREIREETAARGRRSFGKGLCHQRKPGRLENTGRPAER